MTICINMNADMAEGFGDYNIGHDNDLLVIVKTANIACGKHGGDPGIMRETAIRAAEKGVSIGAHPGFDDLWGFGRRQIDMRPDDLEYLISYQIGAMQAMASYAGIPVTHVKVHGALNNMACTRANYADAIARAIKAVDLSLIHLVMPGTEMERATLETGLRMAREAFIDRTYEDDGTLTPRRIEGSVIRDADAAAERVVRMVTQNVVTAHSGNDIKIEFDSLCVHGDEKAAVNVALRCRQALEAAGVEIVTLPQVLGHC